MRERIQRVLEKATPEDLTTVSIHLHNDGVTTFSSSAQQLRFILSRTVTPRSRIFLVDLFERLLKPADVEEYLRDTVNELRTLMREGVMSVCICLDNLIAYISGKS